MHPHEEAIIERFVAPHKRQRLLALLESPRKRRKLLDLLYHFYDLDPRFAHRIVPRDQFIDTIYELLRARGAPAICHVMSADRDLDGRDMDLREALEQTVGHNGGTFLSCIPGRFAYFEGENLNERYILERPGDGRSTGRPGDT